MVATVLVLSIFMVYFQQEIEEEFSYMSMTEAETKQESEGGTQKGAKPSWVSLLLDMVSRHAKEVVGGALAIAGTVEGDIRAFIMRFIREIVLGMVFLLIGFGFVVFGLGMALVEMFRLGPSAGSIVVGTLFVATGALLLVFSRR